MASTVQLPVPLTPRLEDAIDPRSAADDYETLRNLALGVEAGELRARAIVAIAGTDHPGRIRDLGWILADESTPLRLRHLAARLLGRIDADSARGTLVNALTAGDVTIAGVVSQSLGRIGGATAIRPLGDAVQRLTGPARAQAEFALELLTHRLDLEAGGEAGTDVPLLPGPGDDSRRFRVGGADSIEAQIAVRSLARTPFGIELNEVTAHQIRCDDARLLALFDARLGDRIDVDALFRRKRLAAVIARRSQGTGLYGPTALVLTAPAAGGERLAIRVHQTNGTLTLTGAATRDEDAASFTLRAVTRPGAAATLVEGVLDAGGMRVSTARTSAIRVGANRPRRIRSRDR